MISKNNKLFNRFNNGELLHLIQKIHEHIT